MSRQILKPVLISVVLVLPLIILEFLNNPVNEQNVKSLIVLFGFIWLLTMAFVITLMPIVGMVRAGGDARASPSNISIRIAVLTLIAVILGTLVIDQAPCFMRVPNCD